MSHTSKRFRSLVIMIMAVVATNIAISFASDHKSSTSNHGLTIAKSGVPNLPDFPRPKSGVPNLPDFPRP